MGRREFGLKIYYNKIAVFLEVFIFFCLWYDTINTNRYCWRNIQYNSTSFGEIWNGSLTTNAKKCYNIIKACYFPFWYAKKLEKKALNCLKFFDTLSNHILIDTILRASLKYWSGKILAEFYRDIQFFGRRREEGEMREVTTNGGQNYPKLPLEK